MLGRQNINIYQFDVVVKVIVNNGINLDINQYDKLVSGA